jgi:HNH endonuclease
MSPRSLAVRRSMRFKPKGPNHGKTKAGSLTTSCARIPTGALSPTGCLAWRSRAGRARRRTVGRTTNAPAGMPATLDRRALSAWRAPRHHAASAAGRSIADTKADRTARLTSGGRRRVRTTTLVRSSASAGRVVRVRAAAARSGATWHTSHCESCSQARRYDNGRERWRAVSAEVAAELIGVIRADPCAYCGSRTEVTIDHIDPLSAGGKHVPENIAAACRSCNASKKERPLLLFLLARAEERPTAVATPRRRAA